MPRGGNRQGTPGAQYQNRSDLATGPRKLPVQAAMGQPYGVAGQQRAAEQAVPLASGPTAAPTAAPTQPQGAPPGAGFVQPTPLLAPTERPNEPVTAGSPLGPGPGPSPQVQPIQTLGQLFNSMASGPNSNPDVAFLNNLVQSGRL